MKKILAFIFSLVIVVTLCACTAKKEDETPNLYEEIIKRNKLIVGVNSAVRPFGYTTPNGELDGFDVDLAKLLAKHILGSETKLEVVPVNPTSRIRILNTKKVDIVIATMTITPQRQMVVDFSIPYYIAGQALMVRSESKINSIADLKGKTAIVIFGSTAEQNIRLLAPETKIIGYKSYDEGYKALKNKKGDAITTDDTILWDYAIKDASVKLLPKRYTKEPYGIALRKSDSKELKEKIDSVLEYLLKTGQINQLKAKWKI